MSREIITLKKSNKTVTNEPATGASKGAPAETQQEATKDTKVTLRDGEPQRKTRLSRRGWILPFHA